MQKSIKKVSPKKEFFKTYSLSFNTDELIECLEKDDPEKSITLNGKRVWTKDYKPDLLNQIDTQLRKNFKIPEDSKNFITVHYPCEKGKKDLEIKESSKNVSTRILIDTISETINFKSMNSTDGNLELKKWEALMLPPYTAGIINFKLSNRNFETVQERKGFRSQRRTKNISKRYLIIFDYLINKTDFEQLNNIFTKQKNNNINKKDFDRALEDLIS